MLHWGSHWAPQLQSLPPREAPPGPSQTTPTCASQRLPPPPTQLARGHRPAAPASSAPEMPHDGPRLHAPLLLPLCLGSLPPSFCPVSAQRPLGALSDGNTAGQLLQPQHLHRLHPTLPGYSSSPDIPSGQKMPLTPPSPQLTAPCPLTPCSSTASVIMSLSNHCVVHLKLIS